MCAFSLGQTSRPGDPKLFVVLRPIRDILLTVTAPTDAPFLGITQSTKFRATLKGY